MTNTPLINNVSTKRNSWTNVWMWGVTLSRVEHVIMCFKNKVEGKGTFHDEIQEGTKTREHLNAMPAIMKL